MPFEEDNVDKNNALDSADSVVGRVGERASFCHPALAAMSLPRIILAFLWVSFMLGFACARMLLKGNLHWLPGLALCVAALVAGGFKARRDTRSLLAYERARNGPCFGRWGPDHRAPALNSIVAIAVAESISISFLALIGYFH